MRARALMITSIVGVSACTPTSNRNMHARPSAAALIAECLSVTAAYEVPAEPNGPPDGNQNSEPALAGRLGDLDEKERAEAAKKLLRHSERRSVALLNAAVHVAGTLGDFRVLNDLQEIITEHGRIEDGSVVARIAYPARTRVGAAASIGRILEQDRSSPPGHSDAPGDGISDEAVADSVAALVLASCTGQPLELRSAAIEALGLTRDHSSVEFLELLKNNPGEEDENENLLLDLIARRALTNITHNNHLANSDVDERVAELLLTIQASTAAEETQ